MEAKDGSSIDRGRHRVEVVGDGRKIAEELPTTSLQLTLQLNLTAATSHCVTHITVDGFEFLRQFPSRVRCYHSLKKVWLKPQPFD